MRIRDDVQRVAREHEGQSGPQWFTAAAKEFAGTGQITGSRNYRSIHDEDESSNRMESRRTVDDRRSRPRRSARR
ncbi:hypothetical protein PSAB6_190088 [Paraburkholderia sabiae]|nr:hypothetical protein PSAB6_190088 [Paraburkholderia sabiae]